MISLEKFKEFEMPSLKSIIGGNQDTGDHKVIGKNVHEGVTYEDWEFEDGTVICFVPTFSAD